MNIGGGLSYLIGLLDFAPGLKTKLGAAGLFVLAVISAWNSAAPQLGVDFMIHVPEYVNALVMALLGVGVANAQKRLAK